jgi:hypothetical protein
MIRYKRNPIEEELRQLPLATIAIIMLCCVQCSIAQSFVLSVRPELMAVSGAGGLGDTISQSNLSGKPIETGIARGGWAIESGLIRQSGGFYTVSVHGGLDEKENIGFFFNMGVMVEDGLGGGLSLGFHRIPYHVDVIKNNVPYDRYTDYNYIIGGFFLKFLLGETHNFDITPKVLFGYRESHFVIEDSGKYRYYYDDNVSDIHYGATAIFSLGVGYTLTTGRK